MKTYPPVSVVVLNYNSCIKTLDCINSLLTINYDNYYILEIQKELYYHDINLISFYYDHM